MSETRDGVTLIRVGTKANKSSNRQSSNPESVEVSPVESIINAELRAAESVELPAVVGEEVLAVESTGHLPPDESVGPEVSCSNIETGSDRMSGIGELAITKPAPQFEAQAVVDGEFKTVKLSDYKGKYVVLFFYPLDFTFVCPTEIISFSDRVAEFRSINCEVLACSTDSVFSHLAWINTPRKQGGLGPMSIPLIADKNAEISKKYGCLKGDEGIAFRGLYIIDDKGNLRQITINDLPVGRSVDETLRLVQAFQFTDKHGEVCPAGWKPGSETLKPNAKGISEYLSKH